MTRKRRNDDRNTVEKEKIQLKRKRYIHWKLGSDNFYTWTSPTPVPQNTIFPRKVAPVQARFFAAAAPPFLESKLEAWVLQCRRFCLLIPFVVAECLLSLWFAWIVHLPKLVGIAFRVSRSAPAAVFKRGKQLLEIEAHVYCLPIATL